MNSKAKIFLTAWGILFSLFCLAQPTKKGLSEKQRMEFDKRFFSGMKEKMIRNFADAESEFKAAVAIDPQNANVHFQLATVLLSQKKISEALMESERAFKMDPGNEWYSKFLIELYKNEKRYEEVSQVCSQAYKQTKNTHFLFEQSGMYILLGKISKAIDVLNQIEKIQGVTEQVSRQKEDLYLSQGKGKQAIREIEKLSKTFPDQVQYRGLLADLYMSNKRLKEGLEIYQSIQKADPKNGYAAFSLADYYRHEKDTQAFFRQLQLGMQSHIETKFKMQVLGQLIPSGEFGSAHQARCMQLTEEFIQSNPDASEPYLIKGDLLLQARNLEEARKYYLISAGKNANSTTAWDQILFCDQQLQRYDFMKEDCARMIELFPEYATAYLFHSMACRQLKEYDAALQSAQTGLTYAIDENTLIQMLSNLGDIAFYAKNYSLSDSSYEAVLAIDPKNSLALNNYAYFLSLRNTELDKAENMSKLSIDLDPNNPSNLDTYGWILFIKKNYTEARKYIEKSLAISPGNAEVLEHLGDVLFRLNEAEQALENWKRAKTLGASSEALEMKIKLKALPLP